MEDTRAFVGSEARVVKNPGEWTSLKQSEDAEDEGVLMD